jgi:hypothetical protein
MNKKGFLLAEETLKIIIAVVCISLLIYLLVSIYNNKVGGEDKLLAKGVLDRTQEIISSLQNGQSEKQDLVNPEPRTLSGAWYFLTFTGNSIKPNTCLNENCVCICPNALDYNDRFNRQQKKCAEKGVCLIAGNLMNSNIKIEIEGVDNPKYIRIKKDKGLILIED